jgi:hypothetical protein
VPKTKISEYSTTNADNSDIEGINIAEGCAPSGINNAIRELMVHLKEFETGSSGDSLTVGGSLVVSGTATLTAEIETRIAIGTGSGTQTADLATGNYFTLTTNGNTTIAASNVPASGKVGAFILELTNGGGYTITHLTGVTWAGGTAPTLTTTGTDILAFYTFDGGTTWRGLVLGLDVKAP